jgi:hypothetical protein
MGVLGHRGEVEAGRRIRTMVRSHHDIRYSHPPYSTTFFSVLLSSTDRPPSSAGLEVRQQVTHSSRTRIPECVPQASTCSNTSSKAPARTPNSNSNSITKWQKILGHDGGSKSTISGSTDPQHAQTGSFGKVMVRARASPSCKYVTYPTS